MKLKFNILMIPLRADQAFKPGADNVPIFDKYKRSIWFLWYKSKLSKGSALYPFQYTLKKIG